MTRKFCQHCGKTNNANELDRCEHCGSNDFIVRNDRISFIHLISPVIGIVAAVEEDCLLVRSDFEPKLVKLSDKPYRI